MNVYSLYDIQTWPAHLPGTWIVTNDKHIKRLDGCQEALWRILCCAPCLRYCFFGTTHELSNNTYEDLRNRYPNDHRLQAIQSTWNLRYPPRIHQVPVNRVPMRAAPDFNPPASIWLAPELPIRSLERERSLVNPIYPPVYSHPNQQSMPSVPLRRPQTTDAYSQPSNASNPRPRPPLTVNPPIRRVDTAPLPQNIAARPLPPAGRAGPSAVQGARQEQYQRPGERSRN